jgi:precorrin-6Y C5,15-methyltransferase (decarboxylating)
MYDVLLFAGTTEGRRLASILGGTDLKSAVFTATSYGGTLLEKAVQAGNVAVHEGKLSQEEIHALLQKNPSAVLIDATHPYAERVSEILRREAELCKNLRLRIHRPEEALPKDAVCFDSVQEACGFLSEQEGNVLLTTGSKELSGFLPMKNREERLYARVLSIPSVVEACAELGVKGSHLLCMQGPFSKEMNLACIHMTNASFLVTKESGKAGGFEQKVSAAKEANCRLVVIRRPADERGLSVEECVRKLSELFPGSFTGAASKAREDRSDRIPANAEGRFVPDETAKKKQIGEFRVSQARNCKEVDEHADGKEQARRLTLIGAGCGGDLTENAIHALQESQLVIGAARPLALVRPYCSGAELITEYRAKRILEIVQEKRSALWIAVALSGDGGFYSGASGLRETFADQNIEVLTVPGISSFARFAALLGTSYDDAALVSIHGKAEDPVAAEAGRRVFSGKRSNPIGALLRDGRVFCLLGKGSDAASIASELCRIGLPDVRMAIGERLGLPDERVLRGKARDWTNLTHDPLSILYLEQPETIRPITDPGQPETIEPLTDQGQPETIKPLTVPGIPDDAFLRDRVPMTKEEVRAVSLAKLRLRSDSVVYDVGAGSGSISVEASRLCPEGMVYAIERKKEAAELIRRNAVRFHCPNLEVVEGEVPEALLQLPPPDCVFIGGGGTHIARILEIVCEKNHAARFVINAITVETLSECVRVLTEAGMEFELVQLSVARAKEAGRFHMMMGQNPIFILTAVPKGQV